MWWRWIMSRLEAAALAYAAKGWPVFPLKPGEKRPATAHGVKDATTDLDQVAAWWRKNSEYNIGMACGEPSGVWVLDVDGDEGHLALLELGHGYPFTLTQYTPSGGVHFFFRHVPGLGNTASKIAPKVDSRGDGGYIVLSPSQVGGRQYRWAGKGEPEQIPGWLVVLAAKPLPKPRKPIAAAERSAYAQRALVLSCDRVASAGEGMRNDTLNREAFSLGTLVGAGMLGHQDVAGHLLEAALACGLSEREACQVIERAVNDGTQHPREVSDV
jgi:hypothetical protein